MNQTLIDIPKVSPEILTKYVSFLEICKPIINENDLDNIHKAFKIATEIYGDSKFSDNITTIEYSVTIAAIVSEELGLGAISIICSLLYQAFKNAKIEIDEIAETFGQQASSILQGIKKIEESINLEKLESQSENFINLAMTLSTDVKSIMIKLAFCLYNMRNISVFSEDIQHSIKLESSVLYAPIAHRLGLYKPKTELEELMMKYNYTDTYRSIAKKLNATKVARNNYIDRFIDPLNKVLKDAGLEFEIKGRPKSIQSIWKKMKAQNVSFEKVYDLFAIRIILTKLYDSVKDEKIDCWKVFSIITDIYNPNSDRMRDWISNPKKSGYESLHATVIGPENKWIEVQIRTQRMDDIAEKGYAAHWKYKESKGKGALDDWLAKVRETLESKELRDIKQISPAKKDLYSPDIFVFTPKGDLRKMATDSTVLDFAFEIHSKIGFQCRGGVVNNLFASLGHKLKNGDMVKILTSKKQHPNTAWLKLVNNTRTRNKIKQFLKNEEYKNAKQGKEIILRKLDQLGIEFSSEKIDILLRYFNYSVMNQMYDAFGSDKIDPTKIKDAFEDAKKEAEEKTVLLDENYKGIEISKNKNDKDFLIIEALSKIDYTLAKCCNPILDDKVFGFVTVSKGTKIHKINCPNAKDLHARYPYRIVPVKWTQTDNKLSFIANIRIIGNDKLGILKKISKVLSDELKVNIRSLNADANSTTFNGTLSVYVNSVSHLDNIMQCLREIKDIHSVERM